MNPYEIYKEYVSLKTHFNSEGYDYFRHHPKNTTIKAYNARKDKWVFEKLEPWAKDNLTNLIVSNLILDHTIWPEFLIRKEAHDNYAARVARIDSLGYVFVEDLKKLDKRFDKNIICEKNELPYLIRLYVRTILSLETVCIMTDLTNCIPYWKKQLHDEFLWVDRLHLRLVKYKPFITFDRDEYRRKLVKVFGESNE